MRIVVQVNATSEEADSAAHEVVDYLMRVEDVEVVTYWVEADGD